MGLEGDWLLSAARAAPDIDPSLLVAATGSAPNRDTALTQAGATNAFGGALQLKQALEKQDPTYAHKAWQSLTMDQQAGLIRVGYQPVQAQQAQHHHTGLLGRLGGAVEGAVGYGVDQTVGRAERSAGAALGAVGAVGDWASRMDRKVPVLGAVDRTLGSGISEANRVTHLTDNLGVVARGLNRPLENLQHLYRAAALLTDEEKQQGAGNVATQLFNSTTWSPGEWQKMWQNSANGNTTFSPVEIARAEQRYGVDTVALAKRIASGADQVAMLKTITDPAKQQEFAKYLSSDKNFKQALAYVQASHISLGRRVVPAGLAVTNPTLHTALTGGIDAVADWYADPIAHGLGAVKEASNAMYAVRNGEDVLRLYEGGAPGALGRAVAGRVSTNVQREFADVAAKLTEGGAGKLIAEKPSWAGVAEQMAKDGVDSGRGVADWLSSKAAAKAWLSGDINGARATERIIPHMSTFGERTQQIKTMGANAIDWADATKVPLVHSGGSFLNRLVTQLPKSGLINAASSGEAPKVLDYARQFLPEQAAREVTSAWAAAPDIAARRKILLGMYSDMGDTLGLNVDNSPFLKSLTDELSGRSGGTVFSAAGHDRVLTDAGEVRSPLRTTELSDVWSMPSFKDWLGAANKYHFFGINGDGMDVFYSQFWRPAMILRPAFALRAGGEEMVSAMMRYGPAKIVKAGLARSAVNDAHLTPLHEIYETLTSHLSEEMKAAIDEPRKMAAAVTWDRARHAFRHVEGKLAGEQYLNAAKRFYSDPNMMDSFARSASASAHGVSLFEPQDIGLEVKKGGVWVPVQVTSTRQFVRYLNGDPEMDVALAMGWRHIARDPWSQEALRHLGDADGGVEAVAREMAKPQYDQVRSEFLRSTQTADGDVVMPAITNDLERLASKDTERTILHDWARKLVADTRDMVTGAASRDEAAFVERYRDLQHRVSMAEKNQLTHPLTEEQQALVGGDDWKAFSRARGYSEEEVRTFDEWMKIHGDADFTHDTFSYEQRPYPVGSPNEGDAYASLADPRELYRQLHPEDLGGQINRDLAERLAAGEVPDLDEIRAMGDHMKPAMAVGPRYLPVSDNPVRDIVNKGFFHMVGKPMDWMIRQPLFIHNYAVAEAQVAERAEELGLKAADIHKLALQQAVNESIPFLHDPRQRSQFAVVTRNIFPFWFAQEQAYKRFARTLAFSPASLRQAQLVLHGMTHSGFVQKDNQGRDVFHYPASGLLQEVLAPALNLFFGKGAVTVPVQVGFSGLVAGLNPATDRLGVPAVGPLISTPLNMAAKRFPELDPTNVAVLGEKGAQRAWWQSLLPSAAVNVIQAFNAHTTTSQQALSATNQAIAQLESTGNLGLDASANPEQYDAAIGRITQWARGIMFTRAILGMIGPSSPTLEFPGAKLSKEFVKLIGDVGYDQAIHDFIALHPGMDVTPFEVSTSKSASSGPIPSTKKTFNFMTKNEPLLAAFPRAGGWLVPQDPGAFDPLAFREQLLLDLRNSKQPAQFIRDVQFAKDKDPYFEARDARDRALKLAKHNTAWTQKIQDNWSTWSADYKATHRLFADVIDNPQGAQNRAAVLGEMRQLFNDPRLPKGAQVSNLKTLVAGYDQYQALVTGIKHRHDSQATHLKESYAATFAAWAKQYAEDNQNVSAFYHAIIEPDVKVAST